MLDFNFMHFIQHDARVLNQTFKHIFITGKGALLQTNGAFVVDAVFVKSSQSAKGIYVELGCSFGGEKELDGMCGYVDCFDLHELIGQLLGELKHVDQEVLRELLVRDAALEQGEQTVQPPDPFLYSLFFAELHFLVPLV